MVSAERCVVAAVRPVNSRVFDQHKYIANHFHSLSHSLTHSLTHKLCHRSFIHSFIHPFIQSLICYVQLPLVVFDVWTLIIVRFVDHNPIHISNCTSNPHRVARALSFVLSCFSLVSCLVVVGVVIVVVVCCSLMCAVFSIILLVAF